jgi:hypothetical protein
MKNKIHFLLALLLCAGCSPAHYRITSFDSDPQGCRVFLGYTASVGGKYPKEYLGTTPFTNTIEVGRHDTVIVRSQISGLSSWVPPLMVVSCAPPFGSTNLFEQRVALHADAHFIDPQVVPRAFFFDMHTPPK